MELNQKTLGIVLITFALILMAILFVVKLNFDSQAVFLCEAVNLNPDIEMADCPAHKSSTPWLLMIAFGVSSVILASGVYLLFMSRKKFLSGSPNNVKPESLVEINATPLNVDSFDISSLNEDETNVFNLIKENKGSIYQSEIVKKLDLSKVKVTRILDKLEHVDRILERKRRGMANIVVLK